MREQPQPWGERTAHVPPQDPWADVPTTPVAAQPPTGVDPPGTPVGRPYQRGVAHVRVTTPRTQSFPAPHEPTGTGWPDAAPPAPRQPLGWHLRRLRQGGEWSFAAGLFAFVCWGIWALTSGTEDLLSPVVVFVLILGVAAGLFGLVRLLGGLVFERYLGRERHSARGAHLVTAVFLVGVGLTYLRQLEWVGVAWTWLVDLF